MQTPSFRSAKIVMAVLLAVLLAAGSAFAKRDKDKEGKKGPKNRPEISESDSVPSTKGKGNKGPKGKGNKGPKNRFEVIDLNDAGSDAPWSVEFAPEKSGPGQIAGTYTFTYAVTVTGDPALSHFTLGFPECEDLSVVGFSPDRQVEVGTDPTSGVAGVKWDFEVQPGQTVFYSYTIDGNPSSSGTANAVTAAIKAGQFVATQQLPGPICGRTMTLSGILSFEFQEGRDYRYEPAQNADVTLIRDPGRFQEVFYTQTGTDGSYEFVLPLEPDVTTDYDLIIQAPGQLSYGTDNRGNPISWEPRSRNPLAVYLTVSTSDGVVTVTDGSGDVLFSAEGNPFIPGYDFVYRDVQ